MSTLATDAGAVVSITLDSLFLNFTGPDPLTAKISSDGLKVQPTKTAGPIPLAYPITGTKEVMMLNVNKVNIARFSTPWASAKVDGTSFLSTTVEACDLHIPADKQTEFSNFITSVIMSKTSQAFTLKGTVDANLTLSIAEAGALGVLAPKVDRTLPSVGFSSDTSLIGLGELASTTHVKTLEYIQDATDGSFVLSFQVNVNNPSQFSIAVEDLSSRRLQSMG
ncbi:hypothetical protein BGW39_000785 [Mortierella sp. 14UC]|nr:hypothetical protein BGW39_000785 [Mortierella sp. 14UC]